MRKVKFSELPEEKDQSPKGKYQTSARSISEGHGYEHNAGTWNGGPPFDLEWVRLPAGAINFPFHAHFGQWEMFVFISGRGQMRGPEETVPVEAGDTVIFPPGEAHQIINDSEADLVYYVIADNPPVDVVTYPDSGKWAIRPPRKHFRMTEVPYYQGED
jgi:uncharacterized cupin superfamily protein